MIRKQKTKNNNNNINTVMYSLMIMQQDCITSSNGTN